MLLSGSIVSAQKKISGVIRSADEVLPGVTIQVKGTTLGAVTDADGKFSLAVPSDAATLVVAYTGFEVTEIPVDDQSEYNLTLKESSLSLGEFVVTALGVEREKKALGYAVQDVKAANLIESRSTNVVNSLSGRIAGIQVSQANVVGGGSQVTIRGSASILGNNQPLYVIDGVPMEGDFARPLGEGRDGAAQNNVYGGGISEISADNIESITVLKGANAAALYGARAANGVILVKTKNGGSNEGMSVEYNSNATFERPFVVPQFQDIYGGGNAGVTWYADGRNGGITDPEAIAQFRAVYPTAALAGTAGVDESWGAPMDGRMVRHWWSGKEVTPLAPVPASWENYWETGMTFNNNLAISSRHARGSFRFAYGRTDQQGILYNNDFTRNNFRLNIEQKLTNKLTAQISSEYIKSGSGNRQQPQLWEMQTWHHRHDDWGRLKDWEQYMDRHIVRAGDAYPYANWQHSFAMNPFYAQEFLTRSNDKDRVLGNITLNYKLTNDLSLMLRSGTDLWTDTRVNITRHAQTKSGASRTEAFEEEVLRRQETNSDFLITYNKYIGKAFSLNVQAGGSNRQNYFKQNYVGVNDLTINGLYTTANNATANTTLSRIERKTVNSLYAAASLGLNGYLYLDVTGRNDWSSTLPANNNSYFYPSVSMSAVLTEMFDLQSDVLSYAKLRGSWAMVGNDTDPYRLEQVYEPRNPWNATTPVFSERINLANSELRPERTTGIESGVELRFFHNRIGLDVTLYQQTTTDQIINIAVSKTTGYDSKLINAGTMRNRGIEVMLSGTVVKAKRDGDFGWETTFNFSRNNNEVVNLYTDESGNQLQTIVLQSRRGLSYEARIGEPYGTFVGSAYKRAPDGQVVYKDGIPVREDKLQVLGNATPDWLGGWENVFTWKNFSFGALIDMKMGGNIADESTSTGMQTGIYPVTALGREEGVIGKGVKDVGTDGNPVYVPNDVVRPTKSVVSMMSVRFVNEGAIFDGSYIKLRELRLGYSLPSALLGKRNLVKSAKLSLVGRNVAMLLSNHHQIDPEMNTYGGNLQGLNYVTTPSTRSLGFNLNLVF